VDVEHTKLDTVEIMPPNLQGKHNSPKLQVMSGIVSLVHFELPQSICHRLLFLHQNTTKSKMRGITVNLKGFTNIRDHKYQSTRQRSLKLLEIFLTFIRPSEGLVLPDKLCQRGHYLGEPFYESPIVASQTREAPDVCGQLGTLPLNNCIHLCRIHCYPLTKYHMSQKLYFIHPELALG